MAESERVMKTILIAVALVSIASFSALAGSCPGSGCGDKKGKGDKEKDATKESAISYVIEA